MRVIKVCPGIGDNIWLLMKLVNAGERFIFHLPNGKPQRGKQIFDLFPQVAAAAEYVPGSKKVKDISANSISKDVNQFSLITPKEFYLSCNEHLEQGRRIENFLFDLDTTYFLNYQTSNEQKHEAGRLLSNRSRKYIGIYGSSYSSARAWGFWKEDGWFELIEKLYRYNEDFTFVIIGADFDMDLSSKLIRLLDAKKIPYVNTVGKDLGTVVEVLKKLHYFIGFPSGLSILNETLGKNGVMFYPPHLSKMINTWAHPDRIASGDYKGCLFCPPSKIVDWIIANKKL